MKAHLATLLALFGFTTTWRKTTYAGPPLVYSARIQIGVAVGF